MSGAATCSDPIRRAMSALALALPLALLLALAGSCGDSRVPAEPETASVQGVWEGSISLQAASDTLALQACRLRLELVQRDYSFQGLLLRIEPLGEGLGRVPVDTLLIESGTVTASFVSFRCRESAGGQAVFEGELSGRRIEGLARGGGYTGSWQVEFLH